MFVPHAAYAAALLEDGRVVYDLNDPSLTPTVVVEFDYEDKSYDGIYHIDKDQWEIKDDSDNGNWGCGSILVESTHKLSELAERTVSQFPALLDNPGPSFDRMIRRLSKVMSKELTAEIDAEIIKDLNNAMGIVSAPAAPAVSSVASTPEIVIPEMSFKMGPRRKLKAKWIYETQEDLKIPFDGPELRSNYVGKSRQNDTA